MSSLCERSLNLSWESSENNSARSQGRSLIRGYDDLRLDPVHSRARDTEHIHSCPDRLSFPANSALFDCHHVVGVCILLLTGLFSFAQSDRILVQSRTGNHFFLIPRLLSHTDQRRLGHVDGHRWTLSWKCLFSIVSFGGSKGAGRKETPATQGAGILERTIIRQLRQTFNVTFGENLTEVLALVRRKDSSTAADTHLRTGSAKSSLED